MTQSLYADGLPPHIPADTLHGAVDTSLAAAESMVEHVAVLRARILQHIKATGGATDREVELALGLRHQTASARRRELVLAHHVMDSGQRRTNDSGRGAAVWIVVPEGVTPPPTERSRAEKTTCMTCTTLAELGVEEAGSSKLEAVLTPIGVEVARPDYTWEQAQQCMECGGLWLTIDHLRDHLHVGGRRRRLLLKLVRES